MKKQFLFCFLLWCCALAVQAQMPEDVKIRIKRKYTDLSTDVYKPQDVGGTGFYTAHVPMAFGSSRIVGNVDSLRKALKGATILGVEVVYSDHPKGSAHERLTERRLQSAKNSVCAQLLSNPLVEIKAVRQTNCTDAASAKQLFHGVVVYNQPAPDSASRARELTETRKRLEGKAEMERERSLSEGTKTLADKKLPSKSEMARDSSTVRRARMSETRGSYFPCQYIQLVTIGAGKNIDSSFNYMENAVIIESDRKSVV